MGEELREFSFPVRIEDLESYEIMGDGRYVVDEVQDVSLISHEDQIATLRALFHELARSPVVQIHESGMIGPLYSFIRALALPGVVSKEARVLIAHECSDKLTRLLTHVSSYIRRESAAGSGVNAANLVLSRSCTKMYVFAICHVLLSQVTDDDGSGSGVTMSQPIGRPRGGRGRGRGGGGVTLAGDEDISGVDISGREMAVVAISRIFDPSIQLMWREHGFADDAVLSLILRVVFHLLSQKRNVDGEHNAVCGSIQALLSAAAQSMCLQFQRAEQAHLNEGCPNTAPNPKDLLISPLLELLLKHNFAAKFLARWISELDAGATLNSVWAAPLLKSLYEGIIHSACDDVTGDTPSAKNITVFLEELARNRISFVASFPDSTVQLLQAESYEVRKAGITVSAEMLVQRYSGLLRDPRDERRRDDILRELLSHTMDLNPFTRTHCLHQWSDLVTKKAVPKTFFLSLVESAVGRLEDKNHLVRNAALQLIADIMRRNWFSTVLTRSTVMEKFVAHTAETKRHWLSEGKSEEAFLEAWNDARQSQRPQQRDSSHLFRVDEAPPPTGDVEPDVLDMNAMMDGDGSGVDLNELQSTTAATAATTEALPDRSAATRQDPELLRLVYFENALVFIGLLDKALSHAVELLESTNERNVIEAIRFVVVCSEYRLEGSSKAVLRFLVMVFEGEMNIQLAVREAFFAVCFQTFISGMPGVTPIRRSLASALKIISVLKTASEGEINAMDRLLRMLKQDNNKVMSDLFFDAVWSVVDGSVDGSASTSSPNETPHSAVDGMERRAAMRLYAMLAAMHPRDVTLRRAAILEILEKFCNDNVLLAYGFQALQCAAFHRGYVLIEDNTDPNEHPVLKILVRHLCRPSTKLGSWMSMADAAVSAIHHLCKTPVILYTSIVQYLAKPFGRCSASEIVSRIEKDDEAARRVAQLIFIVGHTGLKHLVSIDAWERAQLKLMEEAERPQAAAAVAVAPTTSGQRSARASGVIGNANAAHPPAEPLDVMHKELGMGSSAAKRNEIEDAASKKKRAMFEESSSIWAQHANLAVEVCMQVPHKQLPELRIAAILCLSKLMVANPDFCAKHLPLLFTVASNEKESWIVKTNVLLAIGDLACTHPNHVEPYMKLKDKGLFAMLQDRDARVRAVTVQICSHLVLSEMLRIGDRLHCVVRLVADDDPTIRANAVTFVKNFALKHRRTIGNMIPPLIPVLSDSMPTPAFQETLKCLLEKVEKDKPTESLIEKLCERFGTYDDRSRRNRRVIACNLAFCLAELDYSTEKAMKKLTSEKCYQQYRQWLRDEEVLASLQSIAIKTRRAAGVRAAGLANGGGGERRDRATIEEWEARLIADAASVALNNTNNNINNNNTVANEETDSNPGAPSHADEGDDADGSYSQQKPPEKSTPQKTDDNDDDIEQELVVKTEGKPKGVGKAVKKEAAVTSKKRTRAESPSSSSSSSSESSDESEDEEPRRSGGRGNRSATGGRGRRGQGRRQ